MLGLTWVIEHIHLFPLPPETLLNTVKELFKCLNPPRTKNREKTIDRRLPAVEDCWWKAAEQALKSAATCPGEQYGSLGSLSAGTVSGPEDGTIR